MSEAKKIGRPRVLTDEQRAANRRANARKQYLRRKSLMTPEQRARKREIDRAYRKRRVLTAEQRRKQTEKSKRWARSLPPEKAAALRETRRAYNAKYVLSERQKESLRQRSAEWYQRNKIRRHESHKAWYAANPSKARLYAQNRRALKRQSGGALSDGIVEQLLFAQNGACAACFVPIARDTLELDHIKPISKGGLHCDDNMQLLCRTCNRRKGAKDNATFLAELRRTA